MSSPEPMGENIELLVRGVHFSSDFLLLVQKKRASYTFLPGGHLLFQESAESALEREIREELGRSARITSFLGVVEHVWDSQGDRHHELNLIFRMEVENVRPGDEPSPLESHLRFLWQRLNALKEANLQPYPLQRLLPLWLRDDSKLCWASSLGPRDK